jgi:hypothetical protein
MDPVTGAMIAGSVLGFKGNMQAAKQARQVGEYNAAMSERERTLLLRQKREDEASLRRNSERLKGTQYVTTAASGVTMSGNPRQALADTYFSTAVDAVRIQYGGQVESDTKEAEARMARATASAQAASYRTAAYTNLLTGASQVSQYGQQKEMFALQEEYYKRQRES